MAMNQSLQLRTGQSLVMTEQLQQSIKLLQLSALELSEFIEQELEKNPLLAAEEPGADETPEPSAGDSGEAEQNDEERDSGEEDASLDASDDDLWGGELESRRYEEAGQGRGEGGGAFASDVIEQSYSEQASLKDHLHAQVLVDIPDPAQKIIAAYLIDLVDDAGYLREDATELAERIGCGAAEVEAVIARLQECDPPGVFARDLRECLALQLKERGEWTQAMRLLLEHLDVLAEANLKKLMRLCRVEEAELAEMLALLRSLDPRPGSHFSREQVETLIPDVFVRKTPQGNWRVELNTDVLPRVLVNRRYHAELSARSRGREEKKFLNEHLANASWLVRALDQRAETLLKVSSEMVRQQELFLDHGIRHLKPLTLRHIAERVEVHESTVSRVTSNKYMATPRGVFPMKYFFSSSLVDMASGEGTSSRTVMHLIKELIEAESADAVLSDDTIAETLQERGIDVARRTVVKYRKLMNIPSSVERRRLVRRAL
jgi:RNA polymerase sigma-54 factor